MREDSSSHYPRVESFNSLMENRARAKKSNIILALDLDFRNDTSKLLDDAEKMVELTSDYICAVKINFHLIIPLSFPEMRELNSYIASKNLISIADLKLNDISNTNRITTEYLWKAGFSAVIVNPFVGFEDGLDVVFARARELGKGVVMLVYMSHKGADEGYGLSLKDGRILSDIFLERAKSWGADAVILGTTRIEKIAAAKNALGDEVRLICPGSGAQGGDARAALDAGADYLIFGRSIIGEADPREAVKNLCYSLSPWRGKS